jgi:hypothetical protein
MSWRDYYYLLKKYNGKIEKATEEELESARRGNPNTPEDALRIARMQYEKDKEIDKILEKHANENIDDAIEAYEKKYGKKRKEYLFLIIICILILIANFLLLVKVLFL